MVIVLDRRTIPHRAEFSKRRLAKADVCPLAGDLKGMVAMFNTPAQYAIQIRLGQARWLDQTRTRVYTRARVSLLKVKDSKNLEREDARVRAEPPIAEEPPPGWIRAAERQREQFRLVEVDLLAEWHKLVLWYAEHGREVSYHGWLRWAFRTRLDHTNRPRVTPEPGIRITPMPSAGSDRERARVNSWVRTGKWALPQHRDEWGPAPDQPGCTLPPELIGWAQESRGANTEHGEQGAQQPQIINAPHTRGAQAVGQDRPISRRAADTAEPIGDRDPHNRGLARRRIDAQRADQSDGRAPIRTQAPQA